MVFVNHLSCSASTATSCEVYVASLNCVLPSPTISVLGATS